jgi:hypothetical protein
MLEKNRERHVLTAQRDARYRWPHNHGQPRAGCETGSRNKALERIMNKVSILTLQGDYDVLIGNRWVRGFDSLWKAKIYRWYLRTFQNCE